MMPIIPIFPRIGRSRRRKEEKFEEKDWHSIALTIAKQANLRTYKDENGIYFESDNGDMDENPLIVPMDNGRTSEYRKRAIIIIGTDGKIEKSCSGEELVELFKNIK